MIDIEKAKTKNEATGTENNGVGEDDTTPVVTPKSTVKRRAKTTVKKNEDDSHAGNTEQMPPATPKRKRAAKPKKAKVEAESDNEGDSPKKMKKEALVKSEDYDMIMEEMLMNAPPDEA